MRESAQHARRLAREGKPGEALVALAQAERLATDVAERAAADAEIALTRAWCMYFDGQAIEATDLVLRARESAHAAGLPALEAECAAAAALHLMVAERDLEAFDQAVDAIRLSQGDDHPVRYRAWLAIANVCQFQGVNEHAFPAYRKALAAARAMGDDIASRATFGRMGNAQAHEAFRLQLLGRLDDETLRQAVVGVRSGLQWSQMVHKGQEAIENVFLAMLLRLQGDVVQADALLTQWRPQIIHAINAPDLPAESAAEHGLCRLALGDAPAARRLCDEARDRLWRDEQGIGLSKTLRHIATLQHALGGADAPRWSLEADQALAAFEQQRQERRAALDSRLPTLAAQLSVSDTGP
jgi:hypothetical protein